MELAPGGNKSTGGITEVGSNVQLACAYGNSSDVAGKMRRPSGLVLPAMTVFYTVRRVR
jgi:hypothetical protein